ncbi:MAG TPA: STAS domain-containing protein [Gaiellaceae bacterium]|nr:STAS domain-containing protein [Gaiellaceae bacterium]
MVVLEGEHDLVDAPTLKDLLLSLLPEHELVVVDLSHAVFVDTSVVDALVQAKRSATEQGQAFRVEIGDRALVRRVLEIKGVLDLLAAEEDRPR